MIVKKDIWKIKAKHRGFDYTCYAASGTIEEAIKIIRGVNPEYSITDAIKTPNSIYIRESIKNLSQEELKTIIANKEEKTNGAKA